MAKASRAETEALNQSQIATGSQKHRDPRFAPYAFTECIARSEATGQPIQAMHALLAATARVHELTLVTRNTSDFRGLLGTIINPWR